ncbi:MAG: hypothetical protein HQK49_00895 [Oligoflexia bacterium]|nr:hypothetical protein [Oligoflexia bacterium]
MKAKSIKIAKIAKIIILDFDDSFTYNIYSILIQMGISEKNVAVVPYKRVRDFLKSCNPQKKSERIVLIYGPGPGHPEEYKHFFLEIKRLLVNRNVFHIGICLGHQILMSIFGFKVKRSAKPLHGQTTTFCIPNWSGVFPKKYWGELLEVQCYNSLVVDTFSFIQKFPAIKEFDLVLKYYQRSFDCLAGRFTRGVSYQFHPESIATSRGDLFFRVIFNYFSKQELSKD